MMKRKILLEAKHVYAVHGPNHTDLRLWLYDSAGRVVDMAQLRLTRANLEYLQTAQDDEYEKAAQPQLPWSE